MNDSVYFSVNLLVVVRIGRRNKKKKKTNKKASRPATSNPLKLAVPSDMSEVFYCCVYTECTQPGFVHVSLTNVAAARIKEGRRDKLGHKYVQLYLHAPCSCLWQPGPLLPSAPFAQTRALSPLPHPNH